jgi:hypothetical protein
MWIVDRSIIIIQKKAPFLDWLRNLPDPDKKITLEELNDNPSCYLLPPFEEQKEAEECLEEICEEIFREEMGAWHTEEGDWEADLSLANFRKWFDYKFSPMPVDLVEGEIEKEEY